MSSGGINVRIDKSTHRRVVISALEVVERGLSVLGLTAMPDYTLDAHTKSHGFHVEVVCGKIFYQVRSIIRNIAQIRKETQISYGM